MELNFVFSSNKRPAGCSVQEAGYSYAHGFRVRPEGEQDPQAALSVLQEQFPVYSRVCPFFPLCSFPTHRSSTGQLLQISAAAAAASHKVVLHLDPSDLVPINLIVYTAVHKD